MSCCTRDEQEGLHTHVHSSHPHLTYLQFILQQDFVGPTSTHVSNTQSSKSSSVLLELVSRLCVSLRRPSSVGHLSVYQVLSPVSVQHTAQGNPLRWSYRLVIILGHHANEVGIKREPSQTTRFRRSAHKLELNEEKKARRGQVGTLQAIAHKIELTKEKEAQQTGRHAPGDLGTGPK